MNATEARITSDKAYMNNNENVVGYIMYQIQNTAESGWRTCQVDSSDPKKVRAILERLGYSVEFDDGKLVVMW